jgi:hypothetical protein
MMSHLCNLGVCEFLILARTWIAFGLPSKPGVTAAPGAVVFFGGMAKVDACQRWSF